jgi:CarD family transcriptional regulator
VPPAAETATAPLANPPPATEPAKPSTTAKPAPGAAAAKQSGSGVPTDARPTEARPTDARPTEAKPTEARPTEARPTEAKPTEAKPTEAKPTDPKPTEAKTPEVKADAKARPAKAHAASMHPAAQAAAGTAATAAQPAPPAEAPAVPAAAEAGAAAPAASRPHGDAARRPGAPGMHTGPITAPRIPAKAEVFQEGDHVVYPTHGVGKVERIATEEIAGHKLELIHITFEENRMTLRVPVAKARTAGLRKLATRKLFDEALNVLKGRARIKRTMWSRRAQEYEAKINSGDPLAIAEVVRDLHRNAGQPDQSFSERQIYEAAMERLASELAALDKTDKATAATKLTDFLKTV